MSEEMNIESPVVSGDQPVRERVREGVAAVSEPAPSEAPKPKRRGRKPKAASTEAGEPTASLEDKAPARRSRKRKDDVAKPDAAQSEAVQAETGEVAQARALAQVSQASVARRQRRASNRAAELISEATDVPAVPASSASGAEGESVIPLVDPALRPHRRGRKPKAYVEAEKAALAAAEAAARAAVDAGADVPAKEDAGAEKPQPARVSAGTSTDDAPAERPARASRKKRQAADTAPEPDALAADKADRPVDDTAGAKSAKEAKAGRRTHKDRRAAERPGQPSADRRANRQQQGRKQRGSQNRQAPVEPSLTREELAAMKVAELREKGRELELDVTGKKKAELVEEIYAAAARAEGFRDIEGILDVDNQGFGYIRAHGYMPSRDDAFVPANMVRAAGLRPGDHIVGTLRPSRANDKFPGLAKLHKVNGLDPEAVKRRPKFADLTPIYPNEPLKMEHGKDSITGRAIDIVSPIGKGQRGLIVSPPKAGKTTILKKICQSISANNPEVHLICLLVDERPEEVTDMQRSIKGDVVASTFDMPADNHTRVSELVIERAKRIVELGGDVVVVLDSITRLARAYNLAAPASGRILSGGVDSAALYPPKRFLGAARNIENGGSLTILASALIDTGSKMDEVIFEEFKGTGNMELKLDRDLADRRIFPAIDPISSGTRNEDLLVDETMRPFVWGIRRILAGMNNTERAAASFIKGLKGTSSNQEFLIRTAKKAADHPEAL